jgi:membrane-associated phospholipid phosphatase
MNRRQLFFAFLVAVVLTVLGIFVLDQPIAALVQRLDGRKSIVLQEGTHWLEIAGGLTIAPYFLNYVLLGLGALLLLLRPARALGWIVLFVGSTQLVTRLTVGTLKNVFHRLRPFEVIQAGNWDWKFFGEHGSSFPSGHSAFFWGLFFPLAFLFPRYRLPLLIIPIFISVARIGVNDHWFSDVVASAGLAALITLAFTWIFRLQTIPPAVSSNPDAIDEPARPDNNNP